MWTTKKELAGCDWEKQPALFWCFVIGLCPQRTPCYNLKTCTNARGIRTPLNPTDTSSVEEADSLNEGDDSSITRAEISEAIKQLLGGQAPGMDEVPEGHLQRYTEIWGSASDR